jgi:hypothetical protein
MRASRKTTIANALNTIVATRKTPKNMNGNSAILIISPANVSGRLRADRGMVDLLGSQGVLTLIVSRHYRCSLAASSGLSRSC